MLNGGGRAGRVTGVVHGVCGQGERARRQTAQVLGGGPGAIALHLGDKGKLPALGIGDRQVHVVPGLHITHRAGQHSGVIFRVIENAGVAFEHLRIFKAGSDGGLGILVEGEGLSRFVTGDIGTGERHGQLTVGQGRQVHAIQGPVIHAVQALVTTDRDRGNHAVAALVGDLHIENPATFNAGDCAGQVHPCGNFGSIQHTIIQCRAVQISIDTGHRIIDEIVCGRGGVTGLVGDRGGEGQLAQLQGRQVHIRCRPQLTAHRYARHVHRIAECVFHGDGHRLAVFHQRRRALQGHGGEFRGVVVTAHAVRHLFVNELGGDFRLGILGKGGRLGGRVAGFVGGAGLQGQRAIIQPGQIHVGQQPGAICRNGGGAFDTVAAAVGNRDGHIPAAFHVEHGTGEIHVTLFRRVDAVTGIGRNVRHQLRHRIVLDGVAGRGLIARHVLSHYCQHQRPLRQRGQIGAADLPGTAGDGGREG